MSVPAKEKAHGAFLFNIGQFVAVDVTTAWWFITITNSNRDSVDIVLILFN